MLGDCEKCQGPLCVSGGEVVCENCGHAHPAAAAALGGPPDRSAPPPAPVIPPQEYAATLGDRVLQLEKANARLAARVDQLEAAARPEAQPAGRRR
jgi:ubiquinone biosynthesis protein UbiJ